MPDSLAPETKIALEVKRVSQPGNTTLAWEDGGERRVQRKAGQPRPGDAPLPSVPDNNGSANGHLKALVVDDHVRALSEVGRVTHVREIIPQLGL